MRHVLLGRQLFLRFVGIIEHVFFHIIIILFWFFKTFIYFCELIKSPIFKKKIKVFLPIKEKVIQPVTRGVGGRAGGEKYVVHNILFKFALDSFGLFGGSDLSASKGFFSFYLIIFSLFFFDQSPSLLPPPPSRWSRTQGSYGLFWPWYPPSFLPPHVPHRLPRFPSCCHLSPPPLPQLPPLWLTRWRCYHRK